MSNCSHTEHVSEWISGYIDPFGEYQDGYLEEYTRSTTKDIDLHRYECTQCDKVMYYSQAARLFYEQGIESPYIKGLHK